MTNQYACMKMVGKAKQQLFKRRSPDTGPKRPIRLSENFWAERGSTMVRTNGCEVRFSPHPRQLGFAKAGDARPSHWRPLADRIFRVLESANDGVRRRP